MKDSNVTFVSHHPVKVYRIKMTLLYLFILFHLFIRSFVCLFLCHLVFRFRILEEDNRRRDDEILLYIRKVEKHCIPFVFELRQIIFYDDSRITLTPTRLDNRKISITFIIFFSRYVIALFSISSFYVFSLYYFLLFKDSRGRLSREGKSAKI